MTTHSRHASASRRRPTRDISSRLIGVLMLLGIASASSALTLTTKSSCTCTPSLTRTCSASTTTLASNCTTYTSGSTSVSSTSKSVVANLNLKCDLDDIAIEATPDNGPGTANLVIGGIDGREVTCSETDPLTGLPVEVTLIGYSTPTPLIGQFLLQQQTPLTACLSVIQNQLTGRTTWACKLPPGPASPLVWTLTPVSATEVELFCREDPSDPLSTPIPAEDCFASLGAPYADNEPPPTGDGVPDDNDPTDFPDRDVDGLPPALDFGEDGVVLTFTAPDGVLKFGPCHSGTFLGGEPINCEGDTGILIDETQPELGTIKVPTQSSGRFDAKLIIDVDIRPDVLNLTNKSKTAAFPVVVFGSPGVDVRKIRTIAGSTLVSVGNDGVPQTLIIKNFSYQDVPGPTGVGDGQLDLKVDFLRGDIKAPGTFIFAVTHPQGVPGTPTAADCPKTGTKKVDLTFSGSFGQLTAVGGWVASEFGTEDLTIFNCP